MRRYFAFITFSTIGFGHYYIGDSSIGDTTLVLLTMFSGVAVLSGFIAIIWQTISKVRPPSNLRVTVRACVCVRWFNVALASGSSSPSLSRKLEILLLDLHRAGIVRNP